MASNIVKYLKLDAEKTLGGLHAVGTPKVYDGYKEGIKTGAEGHTFPCLSEGLGFEKVNIKVPGLLQPPFEFTGAPIPVEFEGLEAKVWQDWNNKGDVKLSIIAKEVKPLASKQIKLGGDKA